MGSIYPSVLLKTENRKRLTNAQLSCYFLFIIRNRYTINTQITAKELRVVDDEGKNLGVLNREEALQKAQEQELDLILINALTSPPIAKITSFDKWRYQQEKEEKKQHAHKGGELKQIRITVRAAENDLRRQAQKTDEFLKEGHKVEIMMALRGREKSPTMQGWVREKLQGFLSMVSEEYKITSDAKPGGRGMLMQIVKK